MLDSNEETISHTETLEAWVISKRDTWRDHFQNNYEDKFDEYYRLWRGIHADEDKTRESERSKIISPALQQAVESSVAEIEEATFGRGRFFDMRDDLMDQDSSDIEYLRDQLYRDFQRNKVRKGVAECLINSAVYGTGIAEIVIEQEKEMKPAKQDMMGGQLQAVGVTIADRTVCKLRPIMPHNFLIDPVATSVDDAIGVIIDEFCSPHSIELLQESGVYRDEPFGISSPDLSLDADHELTDQPDDKVRITKYYGLVPRALLEATEDYEVLEEDEDSFYVEAIVVIANESILLKAEQNPYMMNDRPVIAFPWDIVPGRFWGRGVCEKGYNSQKALDAELRARIDALALTIHPMIAMDASRMPRGAKPEVRPGKIIMTNGNPSEILQPFNFGQVGQITFAQAGELQRMVQTATGAIDSAGISGSINGEATAAGISMSLGAIIKRHKRTLINFQESFLVPMIEKTAWRYMQFEPELYPVADYKFDITSSLGIIAREYEVTQLVQLLQTMPQTSPAYMLLIEAAIDSMNLSNREELIKILKEAGQVSPEQQQAQQQAQQEALKLQSEFQQSQTNALNGQAKESEARAFKMMVEAKAVPVELETSQIKAITSNLSVGTADDKEFERRLKVADRVMNEKKVNLSIAKELL
tara:strand:- start:94 stop:2028 length:1935 start_codon:yes stop_codon:yes gene_type:complete